MYLPTAQAVSTAPFFPSSTIRLTIHNAVNRTQTNGTHTCPTYNTYNSTTHTCQRISQNVEGDSKGGGAAYFIVILAALVAVLVLAVSLTCLINFCPKARHTFSSPSSSYSRKYKKRARGAIPTLQPASQQNVASGPMSVLGWGDRRSGVSGRTVQEMIATTRSRVENANPDPMVYLNETFSGPPTPTPAYAPPSYNTRDVQRSMAVNSPVDVDVDDRRLSYDPEEVEELQMPPPAYRGRVRASERIIGNYGDVDVSVGEVASRDEGPAPEYRREWNPWGGDGEVGRAL